MRRMPLNAEELEKIRYIEDSYDFAPEQLQNASKEPKYAKLIALMKEAPKEWCGSVLINDLTNQTLYTGIYTNTDIQLYAGTSNTIDYLDINYDKSTDDMEIYETIELLMTEDNVKTIFGQNITGTGDITMYRHQLSLTASQYDSGAVILSSNKLKIDSLQDLTTVTKATAGYGINITSYSNAGGAEDSSRNVLLYDGTNWKIGIGKYNSTTGIWSLDKGETLVTDINDIVTPI